MIILVINAGSSSLKYQLIDMEGEKVLAKGNCERIGLDGLIGGSTHDGRTFCYEVEMHDHTEAFKEVEKALVEGECAVIGNMKEIGAVGHRVVQGGALFNESCRVDQTVIDGIESLKDLAPLHNPAHLQAIYACMEVFGEDLPQVVVFDNCFHLTMPPEAYMFPVPYEYYEKHKVRRYGFHGTSHRYVMGECLKLLGRTENTKIITCHIGNGSSITAIKDGKVIDTSMGLTPLDGFMMGTRTGTLDPSVALFIQHKEGYTVDQMSNLLNKQSGMLGISGVSSDDRDITRAIEEGNERAALARKMQFYQIRKYIGSYIAALGGVDAIVFTAGIGEHNMGLRAYICESFDFLGLTLDKEANNCRGKFAEISTPDSKIKAYVIPTNEELVIARDTLRVVEGQA